MVLLLLLLGVAGVVAAGVAGAADVDSVAGVAGLFAVFPFELGSSLPRCRIRSRTPAARESKWKLRTGVGSCSDAHE